MGTHSTGPLAVPANGQVDIKFSVHPGELGEIVVVAPRAALDSSWAGIVWNAWVSSVGTVTVRLSNITGSVINVNPQNLDVRSVAKA